MALVTPTSAAGSPVEADETDAPVEVLVRFVDGAAPSDPTSFERFAARSGLAVADVGHRLEVIDGFVATLDSAAIARLEADPRVASVSPGQPVELFQTPDDPGDPRPYVEANELHPISIRGEGYTVAVIDTGVQTDHPSIAGSTGTGINERGDVAACFTSDSSCPGGTSSSTGAAAAEPCTGAGFCAHGTTVAGIAVGRGLESTEPPEPPAIAPRAGLYPVRIAAQDGSMTTIQVLLALDHVWAQRANYRFAAVNLSLGTSGTAFANACDATSEFTAAIDRFTDAGIAVVAATGNDARNDGIYEPACVDSATAVTGIFFRDDFNPLAASAELAPGAIWNQGNGGANIGALVDVAAPGARVRTATTSSAFAEFSGTSAAAPVVSGGYALLRDACPAVTLDEITDAITASPSLTFAMSAYPPSGPEIRAADPNARRFPILDVNDALGRLTSTFPSATALASATPIADSGSVELSWNPAIDANGYLITDRLNGDRLIVDDVTSARWDGRPAGTRTFTVLPLRDGCRHPGSATPTASITVDGDPAPPPPPPDPGDPGDPGDPPTTPDRFPIWTARTPARLVDTRPDGVTEDGDDQAGGPLAASGQLRVQVGGRGDVPTSAAGAIVNVTAVRPEGNGYLTVHPCLDTPPNSASLNYTTGVNLGNELMVGLDDGALCIFSSAPTHVTVDVVGFMPEGSPYEPISPARYLDTRSGGKTFDGGSRGLGTQLPDDRLLVPIAGRGDVPAGTEAVVVYVSAVRPTATGFVTVWSCDPQRPVVSSLNYVVDVNRGNEIIARLTDDGELCLSTSAAADLTLDVVGYIPPDTNFGTLEVPVRVVDTRDTVAIEAGDTLVLENGGGTVPLVAETVSANLTAIRADRTGYLTAYPCSAGRPNTASLNYIPGVNGGNEIVASFDTDRKLCIFSSARIDLTVDITGSTTPLT